MFTILFLGFVILLVEIKGELHIKLGLFFIRLCFSTNLNSTWNWGYTSILFIHVFHSRVCQCFLADSMVMSSQLVVHTDHLFSNQSNDRSGTTCLEKSCLFCTWWFLNFIIHYRFFFCLNKVTHWNVVSRILSYVQLTFTVADISITNFFIFSLTNFIFSKSYYIFNV